MLAFFHTILYVPIYNLLVFLVGLIPGGDVGLGLIGMTLIVRIIILPLSLSAIRTQRAMKAIEPELQEIKEKYKKDSQVQAKETFALYKKYKIKPFSSVLLVFIQLPILISLYLVVRNESLSHVNLTLLYSFIHAPALMSPLFLGIVAITKPSLILAIIVGITQFLQAHFAIPLPPKRAKVGNKETTPESMQVEFGRAMALQARFVFPIVFAFISYASGAIALYFITSNVAMLLQELLVRTTIKPSSSVEQKTA